jgi:hypothetical protein
MTGFSDHKAQILQVQFQQKSTKWKTRLKGEYRTARSYREGMFNTFIIYLEKRPGKGVLNKIQ